MKKNDEQQVEQGIKKTTLLSSTIIIIIVATIIGIVLIKTEYNNFKNHTSSFKNTLIEREKFYIKSTIENIKNDIEFEEITLVNSKKRRIKNQSIIAYNLASSLYNKTTNLSKEEQTNLIISSIRQIANRQSDINYFILDINGKMLLNTQNRRNEGYNFLDFEDINGLKFINKMIETNQNRQSFIEYYWYKPSKRISYFRHLNELGIIIGSSSYLQNHKKQLQERLLKKISLKELNQDEFLFMYHINSLNNITEQSSMLIQRNIQTSQNDLKTIRQLMIDSNYHGNKYSLYENNQKLLYGTYITHLRYFIGVGVNLSHIYDIVQKEKEVSLHNMKLNITKLVVLITIMTIIFFIFSLSFTKKIEKIFKNYKDHIISKEKKYQLLFNNSNDAFIICEINEMSAPIISCNKMASKIMALEQKMLLQKDFFSFFFTLDIQKVLKNKALFTTVQLKNDLNEIQTIELNIIIFEYEEQELLFASLRDITERTLLKEEKAKQENMLIQKSKMAAMGEMIGNIAHQWRQPLSQVSGLILDIETAYSYGELDKKYLAQRVDEANDLLEYMSKTIDDFRNFFDPKAIKEEFSVYDAICTAMNIVKATLKYHNIEVKIECNKNFTIHGYKNEYEQAIVNIISNAKDILIERAIKEPRIKIHLDDNTTLCIEDNAGGIDESVQDKIFDPYFTTKRDYGTGIGLYMTKLIIEDKLQGTINVQNTKEGALFKIKV